MAQPDFRPSKTAFSNEQDKKIPYIPIIIIISMIAVVGSYLLFFNQSEGAIKMVSGTEYISGEYGQVIVRVADKNGNSIEGANCTAVILYPDKSYFLLDYPMQTSSQSGNYYGQFMTPTVNGIYEETITCNYTSNGRASALKISSSFHVSPALNFIVEMSKTQAERYQDLVERINQTRHEVLLEINNTMNKSFDQLIENNTAIIRADINDSKNETLAQVDQKFEKIYKDMDKLGTSMHQIFGNETNQ
jgi:hypothetical protein